METGVLFESIQNDIRDPVSLADEFINAQLPIGDVNLKLTQLLVYSCGIREHIHESLVSRKNINALLDFIDEKSSDVRENSIPLNNSKFFKRCVSFFEHIFVLDWNSFANGGNFDTSFVTILDGFSIWEPKQLHVVSFAIKLKLVTVFLRGGCIEDGKNVMPKVKKYATEMLKKAVFYKTIQCSILATTELYEWIKKDDNFISDENLRIITWMMKMDKPKQVCHGMLIAYSLLRMEHLQDKMVLFVRKLVSIFEDLCFTENNNIFDWICRCSELIYKYHKEAVLPAFWNDLLDNLFAKDRQRAKSVAGFWMGTAFDSDCHRSNIRLILNFLKDVGSEHWKVMVDSIIDDYPAIVDWKLLIEILLDENDGVPEETRLTMTEKEGLLRLMSYTVEELVNGFPPEYRAENMKTLSLAVCHDFACQVTDALLPVFWKLFYLEFTNKERAQITLIHIAKFFNFEMIERKKMLAFVQECVTMFKTSRQAFCHQVVIDLLRLIVNNVRDAELTEQCDKVFHMLKEYCESQMIDLVEDFCNDPNKYKNLPAETTRIAEAILIRILALNRVMILDRKVVFDIPQQMLQNEFLPNNPVFLCILHVSICLMCEHIIYAARHLKQLHEEEQFIPDNYNEIMDDIEYTIKNLSIGLKEWYPWIELGISAFFNLCKVLEAVRSSPLNREMWATLVPLDARFLMTGYVAHMVWKADDEWGPAANINEATKTWIVNDFLNLIECKALPLCYAYDIMTCMRKQRSVMENPLRRFIANLCATEEEATVVNWMCKWMTCLFLLSSKDCLEVVADFVEMIYPIRKPIQNIIYLVVRKGMDFALSDSEEGGKSPVSRHEFLNVLARLCECLDDTKKATIEKYFTENTFKKEDVRVLKSFLRRLKKKTVLKKVEKSTPRAKPSQMSSPILSSRRTSAATVDENLSVWSASSIAGSSSVLADESDLESMYSTDRPILMIRSDNNNVSSLANVMRAGILIEEMSNAAPLASSTPVNLLETLTGNTAQAYGEVNKLFKSLQMKPVKDNGMQISSSVSATSGNINDAVEKDSHVTKATEPVDEVSVSADNPGVLTENTSQVLDNVSDLLKNQKSPTLDACSMAKSPSMSVACYDVSDVSEQAEAIIPAVPIYHISNDVSPRSSASVKAPDSQSEQTSFEYDDVSKLLESLRNTSAGHNTTASSSSMSESSKDGDDILKELQIENPKTFARETSNDGPSVPSTAAKKGNTQAKRSSQVHKNVSNLLRSLESSSAENHGMMKNSTISESSKDGDDILKELLIENSQASARGTSNDGPSMPFTADKKTNAQVKSSSQVYKNVANLLRSLESSSAEEYDMMKNSSMSESGEDGGVDVITPPAIPIHGIPNDPLSTSSIASKDLDAQAESASQVLQNINKLLKNSQTHSEKSDEMAKSPALSLSGANTLKDLSPVSSGASFPEVSMDISLISPPPATLPENTAQAYSEMSKFLKSLNKPVVDNFEMARSPPVSESSEDNDDVLKNLPPESPPTSTQAVSNVIRDLFGESTEENANPKFVSFMASDVLKNLQRVSLSSAETETSDSSACDFGRSPLKKKGKFEF